MRAYWDEVSAAERTREQLEQYAAEQDISKLLAAPHGSPQWQRGYELFNAARRAEDAARVVALREKFLADQRRLSSTKPQRRGQVGAVGRTHAADEGF